MVWADHRWQDIRDYHELRGAPRTWINQKGVAGGGALDIRPGDVVLIDRGRDGTADHIVKAQSYDPATGVLTTIGGNDGGFVIDKPDRKLGKETAAQTADREHREAATGQLLKPGAAAGHVGVGSYDVHASGKEFSAVFGVGRLSLVDFEDHTYDSKHDAKPPPPLKE